MTINTKFSNLIMLVAVLFMLYFVYTIQFHGAPYEYKPGTVASASVACPGDKLTYRATLIVRKTPVTLFRSESWFSVEDQLTVKGDKSADIEVFNWDTKVTKLSPRTVPFTVPHEIKKAGQYRLIVNLGSYGYNTPASTSITIDVPDTCFR